MSDKIIFWLSPDLTFFCLSYYLKKKFDCELYGIVDITDRPKTFFENQTLVNFKKLWFFHDNINIKNKIDYDYFSYFEKKYKINLWKLAINERIFYRFYDFHKFTTTEILSILEQACKLFEKILDETKPDYIICREPGFHHMEIFYEMCKAIGIKVLMLSVPKIGFKCRITQDPRYIDNFSTLDVVEGKNRTPDELKNYLKSYDPYKTSTDLVDKYNKNMGPSKKNFLLSAFQFLFISSNSNIHNHYNYFGRTKFRVILYQINSLLTKKIREQFMEKNLTKTPDLKTSFVYFALGVDLERNILIDAPFCTNQTEIIRHVAKSLPVGYSLFVKEAFAQTSRGWRPKSEYKEIMNIPNVTLIHPSFSPQKLIENSSLVITITGSSGFEAAFYQKPSIIFTDTVYSILPSVFRVNIIEELPKIVQNALTTKVNSGDLDKYITLLENQSFDFDWYGLQTKIGQWFYYNELLVDVDISESLMKEFLDIHKDIFEKLASEYIKKLT